MLGRAHRLSQKSPTLAKITFIFRFLMNVPERAPGLRWPSGASLERNSQKQRENIEAIHENRNRNERKTNIRCQKSQNPIFFYFAILKIEIDIETGALGGIYECTYELLIIDLKRGVLSLKRSSYFRLNFYNQGTPLVILIIRFFVRSFVNTSRCYKSFYSHNLRMFIIS